MGKRVSSIVMLMLLSSTISADVRPYWVIFTDRGGINVGSEISAKIASPLEPKAESRRARILGKDKIFNETDLPVNENYIQQVIDITDNLRTVSRTLNGISVNLDEAMLKKIRALPFVKEVKSVARFRRPSKPEPVEAPKRGMRDEQKAYSYGNSLEQAAMIGVTKIHEFGYMGSGITIAVLDDGFDNLTHAAFDSITISHTRDFVFPGEDLTGDDHGTQVLSVMAGLDQGNLIGMAPYASYILARTEHPEFNYEYPIEEDYWVAGIEWADSLGVDIVNSSLGYTTFNDETGYTYQDLDGDTAVTTVVADAMAAKGIVVVTSAGNEGNSEWHYITTPADGDSVIAIGSINLFGTISSFSSRGPTYDGRIKPDFAALGEQVWVISSATQNSYLYVNGTSYSSPAVAGAVALLLEINPTWTPMKVRNELRLTAIDKGITGSDSTYGYGLVDAFTASGLEEPEPSITAFRVYDPYPQPIIFDSNNPFIFFPVDIPVSGRTLTIKIYTTAGEVVQILEEPMNSSGSFRDRGLETPKWDGTNFQGENVAPGIYYYSVGLFGYQPHTGKIAVLR